MWLQLFMLKDSLKAQLRGSPLKKQGAVVCGELYKSQDASRVSSFCSFWSYTVMRRFREYDEKAEADWRILEFTSSSSNRDGLALRAAADGLLHRPEENKILIMPQ